MTLPDRSGYYAPTSILYLISMRIGAISDTHDCLPMIERAVERLNGERVELVLHAGDLISPFTIPVLARLESELVVVYGNNDGDRELLKRRAEDTKHITMQGEFAEINADGRRIFLLHGTDDGLVTSLVEGNTADMVVSGHTHVPGMERNGKTLALNPGEVCGYLTGKCTVAVIDTKRMHAQFFEL